jgi:non-ribosomal peptide synthetase component F
MDTTSCEYKSTVLLAMQRRARVMPDEPALQDGHASFTAGELLDCAAALAVQLRRCGVSAGTRVILALPVSREFIVAVLATWYCDASFVPVDKANPQGRLEKMVSAACAVAIVHDVPWSGGRQAAVWRDVSISVPMEDRIASREYDDEAYVIFTSGSTGSPKGVSVSHRALGSYLREAANIYAVEGRRLIYPFQLPPSFDAAITSYLLPLATDGVCELLVGGLPSVGLAEFLGNIGDASFLVKTTPSQLAVLGQLLTPEQVAALRGEFVIGGEPLSYETCRWLSRAVEVRVHNEYGPTEATVGCIVFSFSATEHQNGPVPIGEPHGAVEVLLEPAGGDGASSHLSLAGTCLANGYINGGAGGFRRESGKLRYATGDLVEERDGLLYFRGRSDDQVKIGGYRIHLSEVADALRSVVPGVPVFVLANEGALFAIVESGAASLDPSIAARVREQLPRAMWPRRIVGIPQMPLTRHGKVDKAQLITILSQ